jgi:phosphomethylpyrimidine synthase
MIATKDSFEPHSSEQLPKSRRVYVAGQLHADVRVPLREIELAPTKSFNGRIELNDPVRVYDCSGPWGDPQFTGSVEVGLPALRRPWILRRNDVDEYPGRHHARIRPRGSRRRPRHHPRQRQSSRTASR